MDKLKVDRIEVSISGANSSYYPTNTKLSTDKSIDAFVGNEFTLSAQIYPENIVNKNVTYLSSNKSIATVSKDGNLKIVGTGTCSITCKAVFGGKTISFTVNSYEHLQSVSFDKSSKIKTLETPVHLNGIEVSKYVELEVGKTLDVSYTIIPAKHHPGIVTKMACGYIDRYSDFKEGYTYAEVIGNTIRAKQIGECYLFASAGENLINIGNGEYEQGHDSIVVGDAILVRIIPTSVKSISLNKSNLSLQIGQSETLIATILPENATNKNVSWFSSDTSVASVDNYGKIITKSIGDTTIQVKTQDGNLTASCSLKVIPILVSSIEFSKQSIELEPNQSTTIGYTITPINATNKALNWSSSDESVATVNQNGKVTAKAYGKCNITAKTKDGSGIEKSIACQVIVRVSGITLDKTSVEMEVGNEETITPTITPSNASIKDIIYSSNAPNIASVDENGKITAKALGNAIITAKTVEGEKIATCTVKVNPTAVTGITLSKTSLQMEVGDEKTLTPTILPANATNKNITWTSSNEKVAIVDNNGKITAKALGNAIITARTEDGNFTATCGVNVIVKVAGITLSKTSLQMEVGDEETLIPNILPANATNKNVTWTSSNEKVAIVDNNGKITAKALGNAIITARTEDGNFTAICGVNVIVKVSGITLSKTLLQMQVGGKETIAAIITPSNTTEKSVTWVSSNEKVAVVSDVGNVTGVGIGDAIITCTTVEGNKTATCSVTVEPISNYLIFESESEFTITSKNGSGGKSWNGTLYYSTQNPITNLQEWDGNTITSAYNNGKYCLYIFGKDNKTITGDVSGENHRWRIDGENVSCSGDIRSLLNYEKVENTTMAANCFSCMFHGCTSLTSAPALPATSLAFGCYYAMFSGCTSLTSAPVLPATSLKDYCYRNMFYGCTSLTSAPVLPASTLINASGCYYAMFSGCTSLTSAPVLPATTLADACYQFMFSGCTSLTQAPALLATSLEDYCYERMFENCKFLKFSSIKDELNGYVNEYKLGSGGFATHALSDMFSNTGGTFKGTPNYGQTLWTSNEVIYPEGYEGN